MHLTCVASAFIETCLSLENSFPSVVISDSIAPRVPIVIVTLGANSTLKASKKPSKAALLA